MLSLVDLPAEDAGLAGARLAIDDQQPDRQFTNQRYVLEEPMMADGEGAVEAARRMAADGIGFIVADLRSDILLAVTHGVAEEGVLVFNVTAADDRLPGADCRSSLSHFAPSRAMLADALAQYLVWKQWPRWFLILGSHPEDEAFAEAVRRAASRFGGEIVEERVYEDTGGAHRTDSGHVQGSADARLYRGGKRARRRHRRRRERGVRRLRALSNLVPAPGRRDSGTGADRLEPGSRQLGPIQLQNRLFEAFDQWMQADDMNAWTAVRIIGEAATPADSADAEAIAAYMLGGELSIAAFKGRS